MTEQRTKTNSLGMVLCLIEPGTFLMGNDRPVSDKLITPSCFRMGDFDERPVHRTTVSQPFFMGECEVTNAQYEQFDPGHRGLRGKLGFSKLDDEAVVFVSWHDATAFCVWLSEKEGEVYRLPTEAEWEYACRAGTTTTFFTGEELPPSFEKNVGRTWFPDESRTRGEDVLPLTVGRTPANAFGLYDMHGNVEEWCLDWYGPYDYMETIDPIGPPDGDFRVTRGGSHSTDLYYLRSANRMGTIPEERNWLTGFRVVMGSLPEAGRKRLPSLSLHQSNVSQIAPAPGELVVDEPVFIGPRCFVNIPDGSCGPMFSRHNHDPAICECPNGDLLAIWYSCNEEAARELGILASRLRKGADRWESASPFWDAPDRNDHAPALWCDGETIYHFNGLSAAATWGPLQTLLRTSCDSGATWSKARIIVAEHGPGHMPIASAFALGDGTVVLPCDAVAGGQGGSRLWLSEDHGQSWRDAGGTIAGIHASAVELSDGRLLAFGRGDGIDGLMPMSVSHDRGKSWSYRATPYPQIGGGQRLVLKRIKGACAAGEDPIMFISFSNARRDSEDALTVVDASGETRAATGMFCAVSFDDGSTWPYRRLLCDDEPERPIEMMDRSPCQFGHTSAELKGYLTSCQSNDGMIHLLTSINHYAFNLTWLVERSAP